MMKTMNRKLLVSSRQPSYQARESLSHFSQNKPSGLRSAFEDDIQKEFRAAHNRLRWRNDSATVVEYD